MIIIFFFFSGRIIISKIHKDILYAFEAEIMTEIVKFTKFRILFFDLYEYSIFDPAKKHKNLTQSWVIINCT